MSGRAAAALRGRGSGTASWGFWSARLRSQSRRGASAQTAGETPRRPAGDRRLCVATDLMTAVARPAPGPPPRDGVTGSRRAVGSQQAQKIYQCPAKRPSMYYMYRMSTICGQDDCRRRRPAVGTPT